MVVILGACRGHNVLFYSPKVGGEGHIVAIEPIEKNYVVLQDVITKTSYNNITLFNLAIGAETGEGAIYIGSNAINASMCRDQKLGEQTVKIVTWNDLMELADLTYVTLANVDVEGSELQWLSGMTECLPQYIIMEEHSRYGYNLETLLNTLKEKEYTYVKEGYHIYAERKN